MTRLTTSRPRSFWGDGQSDTAEVNASTGGCFEVDDDHTYAAAGSYTFEVEITSADGAMKRVSGTATVGAAALTEGAVNQTAANGVATTFQLGTFADANSFLGTGAFTVEITSWGDGTDADTTGSVTETATGLFDVWGEHTYNQSPTTDASYTVDWTVTATASGKTESESSTVEVGDALDGIPAEFTWGTFTNPGGSTSPDDYTAVETWDDSYENLSPSDASMVDGTVTSSGSGFLVKGEYTYEGTPYSLPSVTVYEGPDLATHVTNWNKDWQVLPAPIQASGVDATANAGVSVSVEVATFTDPDPVANGLDFSATVTAGSGSATFSDPTIVEEGNGKFEVVVNSSDSDAETVEICVAVTAPGDKTATVESNVTFNAALPTLELTSVATPGPQIYTSNEGRWMWATGWNLEGATNNTEGWILQQITYNYKCINKSNEDVTAAVFSQRAFPPAASYWEAWKVVNGKVWWPPKSNLTAWSSSWSTKLGNWARGLSNSRSKTQR